MSNLYLGPNSRAHILARERQRQRKQPSSPPHRAWQHNSFSSISPFGVLGTHTAAWCGRGRNCTASRGGCSCLHHHAMRQWGRAGTLKELTGGSWGETPSEGQGTTLSTGDQVTRDGITATPGSKMSAFQVTVAWAVISAGGSARPR